MHYRIFALALLLSTLAALGPAPAAAQSDDETPTHLFIFVDRSVSALADEKAQTFYQEQALQHTLETLKVRGSRVTIAPLNEKTLSEAEAVTFANDTPPYVEPEFKVEKAKALATYRQQMKASVIHGVKGAKQWLDGTAGGGEFDRWTDIWGIFGFISENATDPEMRYRVLLLTDMFESMPGSDRRDFDARPPASRKHAEQWAREDAKKLAAHMKLDHEVLQSASFTVERGYLAAKDGAQNVKFYWDALAEALEISSLKW